MSRVYVGRLPLRVKSYDLEEFASDFGRVRDVVIKTGFGFIEFYDSRDAEDAAKRLNGRELMGSNVIVEMCHSQSYDRDRTDRSRFDRSFSTKYRHVHPSRSPYKLTVENLSTRCSWQDLKDMMRQAGEVTYTDAHKRERNLGIVCFASHEDLRRAVDKFQGKEINGRRLKLYDDSIRGRSRSPHHRSPARRSRSRSREFHDSRSSHRHRSLAHRSPVRRSRSQSRDLHDSRSSHRHHRRSPSPSPSNYRSVTPISDRSNRSRGPARSLSPRRH